MSIVAGAGGAAEAPLPEPAPACTAPFMPSTAASGSAGGADAAPLGAISASNAPTATVSPAAAWILVTVPATGAAISASTLSVEISSRVSSADT